MLYLRILLLSFLGAISMNLRYNGLILLPLLTITIFYILKQKVQSKFFVLFCSLPLVFFNLIHLSIKIKYDVQEKHHFNGIMFLDIIGVIIDNPEIINEYPYVKEHLKPFYREKYIFGDLGPLLWTSPLILKNSEQLIRGGKNQFLENEYKKLILKHPTKLLFYKLKCFKEMVLQNEYKLNIVTINNDENLIQNPHFSPFRLLYGKVENFIFSKVKLSNIL